MSSYPNFAKFAKNLIAIFQIICTLQLFVFLRYLASIIESSIITTVLVGNSGRYVSHSKSCSYGAVRILLINSNLLVLDF